MGSVGVIFDMDGVLIDSYAPHLRSWRLLAGELDASITEMQFAATFGRTSREIIRELFGVQEPDEVRLLDDRKEALYRDLIRGNVPEMPGARAMVEVLHAAGFLLGVGSSGPPENVALVCRDMGLGRFLSATVTGADVQRGKPDPQVFELVAQRMGVEASTCVVVEDAPAGIEAARRAGMRSIGLVGSHEAARLNSADRVVEYLSEIRPALIRELLAGGPP
ncbi:MAG: HAD family phosphatase [Phycisphaerae bacterium]|nr:HAD family phosphatase [Phycisphaerae bacterium]